MEGKASKRRCPSFKHLGDEVLLHTSSLQIVVDCLGVGGEEQGERRERHCVSGGQSRELSVDKDSYISEDGFEQRFLYF